MFRTGNHAQICSTLTLGQELCLILLLCPTESSHPGPDAAAVPAGLRRPQRVRVLQPAVPILSPLRAAVPLRQQDPRGVACWGRGRRHPHPGQAEGRRGAPAEPAAAAPPRLQEPGGGDPDHGEEDSGAGGRAVHGLDESVWDLHHDASACSELITSLEKHSRTL